MTDRSDREMKLWSVEVDTNKAGPSPGRPSYWSKRHVVNVAAYTIEDAINGALDELAERYGDEFHRDGAWVISASHRGRVNRIVG
jgi:hypothetical protein